MMSSIAQVLIIMTEKLTVFPSEPDPKKLTAAPSEYRMRCSECDDEGRDARLPCEGHN